MSEPKCQACGLDYCVHTLEKQLAERDAEIERLKERLEIGFGFDLDGNRISISENLPDGIDCRDETIKMLDKSIAAMRPMIEACKETSEHHKGIGGNTRWTCMCLPCQWYRDYMERKQPPQPRNDELLDECT